MAFKDPNVSVQIEQINLRLQAIENQLRILSQRAGVPFAGQAAVSYDQPQTGGVTYDPKTGTVSFVDPGPGPAPVGVPDQPYVDQSYVDQPYVDQSYVDPRAGEVPPDVVMLARSGKKIEAIKRYRQLTNADLKTAKNVVDRI